MTLKWHLKHTKHKKPWDVQVEAMRRSQGKDRYAYFLEQGLGKTSLILNDFIHYEKDVDVALIVVPNSFKQDWALAAVEWGVADKVQSGYWPRDPFPTNLAGRHVYAINYEAARTGAKDYLYELFKRRSVMLVIDESAAVKNPQSQTTKTIIELSKNATMVREANGTPIVQNALDYWGQLRCLSELDGVNPYAFKNRHCVLGGYMGKVIQRDQIKNADQLYAILDRCSFRALKKDWRDLPPQINVPVHLEMTKAQQSHYDRMLQDFFTQVNDMDVSADMVLTQMDKLRQISSCLALQDGRVEWLEQSYKNPKLKAALDLMEGGPGKTIIVHIYKASGEMLYDQMREEGLKPARIKGQMKPDDIMEEKRRFNEDPECRVLIGQESATFRGHTLLGGEGVDRCNRMIFYESSFSYYEFSQIRDRNHRGEQDQECLYYLLQTSPMDAIVYDTLQGKQDMASAIDAVVAVVKQWGKK